MDDDLGGADGDGTILVVVLQIVFSQVDSVGATAAWPQRNTEINNSYSVQGSIQLKITTNLLIAITTFTLLLYQDICCKHSIHLTLKVFKLVVRL